MFVGKGRKKKTSMMNKDQAPCICRDEDKDEDDNRKRKMTEHSP
jgi:hypothetical protein